MVLVYKNLLYRLGMCLSVLSFCVYSYQNKQNSLTHLKICLPQLETEIKEIRKEICQLQYDLDREMNPTKLIELTHRPEFSHLKHPLMREILTIPEGLAVQAGTFDQWENSGS